MSIYLYVEATLPITIKPLKKIYVFSGELVELLLILTTKNTSLMSSNHVPLLLGAYNATLSKSDQLLLQVYLYSDFVRII